MNDNINKSTDSVRSSVYQLKSKLNMMRSSLEALALEVEKIDNKFDKLVSETESYRTKLVRQYERRCKLNEKEIRANLIKGFGSSLHGGEEEDDIIPYQAKVASTSSILECIIDLVSGGNEGFKLMSYSVIFPCIYERLMESDAEEYLLEMIPEDTELMVDLGREFAQSVLDRTRFQLSSESGWRGFSSEVQDWWKTDMLPFLYKDKEIDLSGPAWSLEKIRPWREDKDYRLSNYPSMYDVYQILRVHRENVVSGNGVNKLEAEFIKKLNGRVNFD